MSPKFKDVIAWREFRMAWALLVLVLVAFVIDALSLTPFFVMIEGGLLFLVFILVVVTMYRTAAADRGSSVERNELKSILASLEDSLVVYDKDFKATFFNPAAEHLFKLSQKEVLGHVFSPRDVETDGWRILAQVIFPSLAPRVILRTPEGEYPQTADISFTDPELEIRVTTAPVVGDNHEPLAFMKIIRNRTAQIEAIRSKSEFVTVASHQLRGPVTDINWALQTLTAATELSDTDKMIVQTASEASQNLLRRIEDLLNIAKMEDGQFGYQFEDVDIVEYVGKILADVLPAARKAGVKMYFDRPAQDVPHVMIDTKRLSLALVNILENAIRYNVENGEVTVKVDRMEGKPFVVVSVKDSGIGIPKDAIPKLFTKFYRADNAMKSQTEGSGLGLYIAKGIVSAHGGQIWAESEVNRGTTILFALPTDPTLVPHREANPDNIF